MMASKKSEGDQWFDPLSGEWQSGEPPEEAQQQVAPPEVDKEA
jgi:hypothetical protein